MRGCFRQCVLSALRPARSDLGARMPSPRFGRRARAVALAAALAAPALGQATGPGRALPAAARNPTATIRRTTNEVLADFVVVDHRGRLVPDLTPAEIEVTDNGVRQRIENLRLIEGSVTLRPRNWRAAGLRPPAKEPPPANLTVLVFDPLAPAAIRLARSAAIEFVKEDSAPGNYLAVFVRRRRLVLLQPFTEDGKALDGAIQRATGRGTIEINYEREYEEYRALAAGFPSGASDGGRGPASATTMADAAPYWLGAEFPAVTNARMLGAMLGELRLDARAEGTLHARGQLAALRNLVALLAPFHGRKTVVLFTQRLYLRNSLRFILRALIREANQAQVTFDPVDVSGLGVRPDLAALAAALRGPTYLVERQGVVTPHVGNAVNSSQTVLLGELASATGGLAVTDTNDPARFMRGIAAASAEHYELAFTPRGFAVGAAPTRHVVVIRILHHRQWRVLGRKTYYAHFSVPAPAGG